MKILVSDPLSSVGIEIFKYRIPFNQQGPQYCQPEKMIFPIGIIGLSIFF